MTRKRFKKLLMSYGYSRDDAEWLTDFAKNSSMSYADIYRNFLSGLNGMATSFAELGEECSKIWSEFKKGY